MTSLRHPHIAPPLVIEVEDDRVPAYTEAGWLLDEEPTPTPDPDPDAPGDEVPTPEEETE